MARRADIICKPLTAERFDDFSAVMGKNGGFCGCWCAYWLLPRAEFDRHSASARRDKFRAALKKGEPPGLIAYLGGEPAGWVRVGPRAATPNWNGARRTSAPIDAGEAEDPAIWAITCFVVPRAHRGKGVSAALLEGAVKFARSKRARAIDACPVEASDKANPASIFHGVASIFERAGFEEIARRRDNRPLMRLTLST